MNDNYLGLVSVIVPAYLKEQTIVEDLSRIKEVLEGLHLDYEIIVVADGTADRTFEKALNLASEKIKVFGYPGKNRGKGYALRFGAAKAQGKVIVFLDSGMEINPAGISMLLEHMRWYKAEVVVGSKRHPVSKVNYPLQRKITSFAYQILVLLLFGLKVKDTQTGLKVFKAEVLEKVLPRLLIKTYAVDIEILAVAHHLGFRRIYEAPVDVSYNFTDLTHAASLRHIWKMLWDTLAVFYRLRLRRYYDDGNQREWVYDPELQMKVNVG